MLSFREQCSPNSRNFHLLLTNLKYLTHTICWNSAIVKSRRLIRSTGSKFHLPHSVSQERKINETKICLCVVGNVSDQRFRTDRLLRLQTKNWPPDACRSGLKATGRDEGRDLG